VVDVAAVRAALASFAFKRRPEASADRLAAVAAVLRDGDGGCELLFIRRAEHPHDPWSGHMAFPGGRVDPDDVSPQAAAERETVEELGLDLTAVATPIGRLSDVTAVARGRRLGLTIEPFAFALSEAVELVPNHEVEEALWIPLAFFQDRSNRSTLQWRFGDVAIPLPCYRYQGRVIWGLTYGMVDELVELLAG
jgi:8-oxo-dGTP pyrophosphatase MutT (NUDIX family)